MGYARYGKNTEETKACRWKNSLLIVTTEERAVGTLENIRKNNYGMYHMAGLVILDRDMQGVNLCGVPVVANSEKCNRLSLS